MTDNKVKLTRDELRAKVFSSENSEYKRLPLHFKGVDLEIKQPTLDQVSQLHSYETSKERAIYMLVTLGYIAGSEEHLFDDADFDQLAAQPYGPEHTQLNEIITKYLVGDIKEVEKNSDATPISTASTQ